MGKDAVVKASPAFSTASRHAVTRSTCPDPIPKSRPPPAIAMAFDIKCLATVQAMMASVCVSSRRTGPAAHVQVSGSAILRSRS